MQSKDRYFAVGRVLLAGQVAGLLAVTILAVGYLAPTEVTMGHAQRIVYVHVPVAWLGLLGFVVMAGSGIAYLYRRDLAWDSCFQAAGEMGWLCCSLTLITGSLWAHEAWGTWWEWDPRLTTSFILWVVYAGILTTRASLEDVHRRARVGAVLAILGLLDIPLVVMATRWFRGLHPVAPDMTPSMRTTLWLSLIGFTVFFVWLAVFRRRQVRSENLVADLQRQAGV